MIELAFDEWSGVDWREALRRYCAVEGLRDPQKAYFQQVKGASSRGIEWKFTFETWWDFWNESYHLRGPGAEGLCMARKGDRGPYSPQNVYVATNAQNVRDYYGQSHSLRERREAKRKRAIEKSNTKRPLIKNGDWVREYVKFNSEFVGPPQFHQTIEERRRRIDAMFGPWKSETPVSVEMLKLLPK